MVVFLFACQSTKNEKVQKIEDFLTVCYQRDLFNGNVLVAEDGEIIYQKSFGVLSYKTGEPLTDQSQFRLASVIKQFTAMAIMILRERGGRSLQSRKNTS
jgi:CubicO group peptidase (beta-lactamase class C family)